MRNLWTLPARCGIPSAGSPTLFADHCLELLSLFQVLFCLGVFCLMALRLRKTSFPALMWFVAVLAAAQSVRTAILYFRSDLHIPIQRAYEILFYSGWISQLVELCLLLVIIYGVFFEAMRPFPGLQRIGKIVFRWVGSVSLLVAIALSAGPELFDRSTSVVALYSEIAFRFQQGIHVLILCLLIFVCFAIRPLGLTFRSYIFGVVLGLGVFSVTELVHAAWMAIVGGQHLYSAAFSFEAAGCCIALLVWGVYFAMPEPKRRMILLPTTSPFFLWNRISEILGDAPGNVAVAGFTPDMLAPAEIEMLTAAISREEATARERQFDQLGSPRSAPRNALPVPSENDFALSR